ncbi:ECF transporter S component [Paenibacillus tyrfis]|uniref:ECF transporter S component n=1 Tax=Paenibacillus tyrfis TaxID=1501230 RepID=UPI0006918807|nr:ECF transporter S component [Paenibacillus tyrfis]
MILTNNSAGGRRHRWTTKDMLVAGLLGVVFSIVIIGANYLYMVATSLVGPVYSRALIGVYMMPGMMALYMIRKPGIGFAAEVIAGFIMMPFTSYGWMMVFGQLVNGIACELPYACFRYRKYSTGFMLAAGAVTGALGVLSEYPLAGYAALAPSVQIGMFIITAASCMAAAWLIRLLSDALMRTGLLADYRNHRPTGMNR